MFNIMEYILKIIFNKIIKKKKKIELKLKRAKRNKIIEMIIAKMMIKKNFVLVYKYINSILCSKC